jgi:hypothetical protein
MYVTLHSSGILRQISDFLVLKKIEKQAYQLAAKG